MRFRTWITAVILVLLLSGCSKKFGKELVFFYTQDLGQIAEFTPDIFSGNSSPLFPQLSKVAAESKYALSFVPVDILAEDYISSFQSHLPQHNKQVIITSFLYRIPEIKELLEGYQIAVVGAAMDIDLDHLDIIGNGFNTLEQELNLLTADAHKITFIAINNNFHEQITQAVLNGAGAKVKVVKAEPDASKVTVPQNDDLYIASYGPYFKDLSSIKSKFDRIVVINFPGAPKYVDSGIKKKVEAFICYDFATSFKNAILKLASDKNEKINFYSFELIRQ